MDEELPLSTIEVRNVNRDGIGDRWGWAIEWVPWARRYVLYCDGVRRASSESFFPLLERVKRGQAGCATVRYEP